MRRHTVGAVEGGRRRGGARWWRGCWCRSSFVTASGCATSAWRCCAGRRCRGAEVHLKHNPSRGVSPCREIRASGYAGQHNHLPPNEGPSNRLRGHRVDQQSLAGGGASHICSHNEARRCGFPRLLSMPTCLRSTAGGLADKGGGCCELTHARRQRRGAMRLASWSLSLWGCHDGPRRTVPCARGRAGTEAGASGLDVPQLG